jgi:hypothetical protein
MKKYEKHMNKYENVVWGAGRLGLRVPAGSGSHSKCEKIRKSMKKYENI